MLATAGARINETNPIGSTPLMMAIRNDRTPVALYLIEKGADPNIDEAGHTALHLAVARKNPEVVKALIERGAKVNVRLTRGEPDPDGNRNYNQLPEYLLEATPFLLATALNETDTYSRSPRPARTSDPDGRRHDDGHGLHGDFPWRIRVHSLRENPAGRRSGGQHGLFRRKNLFTEAKVLETMKPWSRWAAM